MRRPVVFGGEMEEGTIDTPQASRRKIIERPRLTRLLDESPARIKLLIAPAGYGKTTLARQWLAGHEQSAWCVCREQSRDIASFIASLGVAMNLIVPGAGDRARQRVRMVDDPGREVDALAELLIEDAVDWPDAGWLVIDDYQEILGVDAVELLLANVAEAGVIPLLVCSRTKPSWATARRILYEEIQEVSRRDLSLDKAETNAVLGPEWVGDGSTVDRAGGWPALVGLAALTRNVRSIHAELPETLYRFFADEVYAALPEEFRPHYRALAVVPTLSSTLMDDLFGADLGQALLDHGRRFGIITPIADGATSEIHPLLRQYLLGKGTEAEDDLRSFRRRLVEILVASRAWDEAFMVAEALDGRPSASVMELALDDLLQAGRLETLKAWGKSRAQQGSHDAVDAIVTAELCFREGFYGEAQHLAAGVATTAEGDLRARAFLVAGRAAHLGSREEEAFRYYKLAHGMSGDEAVREAALLGELSAAIDLEAPEAMGLLDRLRGRRRDVDYEVNVITKQMMLESRLACLGDLDPARTVERHIAAVRDPLVRCSFRNTFASVLALRAEYEECLEVCGRLEMDARHSRLDFVIPYVQATKVLALVGKHEEAEALRLHRDAYEAARRLRDEHSKLNLEAILSRLHFAASRFDEAYQALSSDLTGAIRSMKGEYVATRALIAAAIGRLEEANDGAAEAITISKSAEPYVLSAGASAVAASRSGSSLASERIHDLVSRSLSSGNLDCLVTVYRGCPELLGAVVDHEVGNKLRSVMQQSGDSSLASALARLLESHPFHANSLSPREREVASLIRDGLTNAEIASALFISLSTAKVHVHHILEKLGVRSRVEIALRLAAAESQATSDAGISSPGVSPTARDAARANAEPDAVR